MAIVLVKGSCDVTGGGGDDVEVRGWRFSMVEVVRWVGDRRGVVIVVMMEVGKGGGGDGFGGCECCEFRGRQDLYGMSSNGEKGACLLWP